LAVYGTVEDLASRAGGTG